MGRVSEPRQVQAGVEGLIARVAQGDRGAFEALYDGVTARVMAVARVFLSDGRVAEEAAQRAWLDVWRRAAQFDPAAGTGVGWILALAQRAALGLRVAG